MMKWLRSNENLILIIVAVLFVGGIAIGQIGGYYRERQQLEGAKQLLEHIRTCPDGRSPSIETPESKGALRKTIRS